MVQAHPEVMSAVHPGFFQRKSVQNTLPLLTSLAFHAGIVVLAMSLYQAVKEITKEPQGNAIVSGGDIDGPVSPIPTPKDAFAGTGTDPTKQQSQNFELQDVDPSSTKFQPGSANVNLNPGGSNGEDADNSMIAIGPGGRPGKGKGPGTGNSWGIGDGEAQKGPAGRIGINPDGGSPVFKGTPARKVVYVSDATGSMTPVFASLRNELNKAIGHLGVNTLGQKDLAFFNVIFFSNDQVMSLSPTMIPNHAANTTKAADFIGNTTARGLTNPLPAIKAAFDQNPEVIYVLTDGFDQIADLSSVVKEFGVLNKDRKVRVNTILISTGDQKELIEALKTIAEKNNGTMTIVSKEDF